MYKEDRRWQVQQQTSMQQQLEQFIEQRQCVEQAPPGDALPQQQPAAISSETSGVTYPEPKLPQPPPAPSYVPTPLRLRSILVDKQSSEPTTPTTRHPSRPMLRNLSDLGPRIKKRVTYRCSSASSFPTDAIEAANRTMPPSILKKTHPPDTQKNQEHNCSFSLNSIGDPSDHVDDDVIEEHPCGANEEDEDMRDFPGAYSPALPRRDRYVSANSMESDCASDLDDGSTMDSTSNLLPRDDETDGETNSGKGYKYHMKPESQSLLMRPEVLKLRKTTC